MKKDFGNLSRHQIKRGYAQLHEYRKESEELESADFDPTRVSEIVTDHYLLYDQPLINIIVAFVRLMGIEENLSIIASSDDPQESWLEFSETQLQSHIPDDSIDQEDVEYKQSVTGLTFLLKANIDCLSKYNITLHDAFKKISSGDTEWIFKLVALDRAIMLHPKIAHHIAVAQLSNDNTFFGLLSKAITRKSPKPPAAKYDDLRLMLEMITESNELKSTQIEDILAHDLELYPTDGDYSLSGLKKMLTTRRKNKGEVK
jgi:hypothetical protein